MNLPAKKKLPTQIRTNRSFIFELKDWKIGFLFFFGFFFFVFAVIAVEQNERKGDECACHGNADEYLEVSTYVHVRFLV